MSFPGMGKFEKEKEECLHNCVCGTYTHVHLYMYVCTVHIYNCMYVCIFRASLVAQLVKNLPAVQETWVQSLCQKDPWKRKWLPAPVFLPLKSHGQRTLVGCTVHRVARVEHNLVTKPLRRC